MALLRILILLPVIGNSSLETRVSRAPRTPQPKRLPSIANWVCRIYADSDKTVSASRALMESRVLMDGPLDINNNPKCGYPV